ncbi:MAG: nucleoside triphosphate pyrophosphohydrolase [Porphyromonas sp.]|nr:nucleoside triphosphate pyrophosphohydrolase [Porphyromonas sp.]
MSSRNEKLEAFGRLLDVLDRLRVECPWDAKQTNDSLRPNTIEEVYELSEALISDDQEMIKKELGDVLLHILFYAKIGVEKGNFDIKEVCDTLSDKLIFRHPHVFGDTKVSGTKEVEQNWEQIKLKEKGGNKTVLSGVPMSLPPLIKAYRIQEKAANVGFDWDNADDVWDKVDEELAELRYEITNQSPHEAQEEELGDFLFSLVNMARKQGLNADTALERTCHKFTRRFNYVEAQAHATNRHLSEMTLDEMDALWDEAKAQE